MTHGFLCAWPWGMELTIQWQTDQADHGAPVGELSSWPNLSGIPAKYTQPSLLYQDLYRMQEKKPYIPHRQQLPLPSAAAFMLISQEIATKPGTWKLRQNCCGHKARLNHKADKPNPKNKKKGKHLGMGSPSSHSHQYHPTSLRTTQRQVKRGHSTFLPLALFPHPPNAFFKAARQGLRPNRALV